jgi:hypothetical protein
MQSNKLEQGTAWTKIWKQQGYILLYLYVSYVCCELTASDLKMEREKKYI